MKKVKSNTHYEKKNFPLNFSIFIICVHFCVTTSQASGGLFQEPIYGDLTYEEIEEIRQVRRENWPKNWQKRHDTMCSGWGYMPNVCRLDLKEMCHLRQFFKLCKKRGLTSNWPKKPKQIKKKKTIENNNNYQNFFISRDKNK